MYSKAICGTRSHFSLTSSFPLGGRVVYGRTFDTCASSILDCVMVNFLLMGTVGLCFIGFLYMPNQEGKESRTTAQKTYQMKFLMSEGIYSFSF